MRWCRPTRERVLPQAQRNQLERCLRLCARFHLWADPSYETNIIDSTGRILPTCTRFPSMLGSVTTPARFAALPVSKRNVQCAASSKSKNEEKIVRGPKVRMRHVVPFPRDGINKHPSPSPLSPSRPLSASCRPCTTHFTPIKLIGPSGCRSSRSVSLTHTWNAERPTPLTPLTLTARETSNPPPLPPLRPTYP